MFLHVANPKPMGIPTETAGSEGSNIFPRITRDGFDGEIHPLEIELPSRELTSHILP